MYLVVGLGNPGSQYKLTYHNIGFLIIDAVCKYWSFQPFSKKANYLVTSGIIDKNEVILLKPYSFMNNSGIPVARVRDCYKFLLDNVIVIHDDADLEFGRVKIKKGGSSAGHNGLKSIDSLIGNDYWRLRFGIGRPDDQGSLADYVLSKFLNLDKVTFLVEKIAKNIHLVLQGDNASFISLIIL
ncbi:aminoacyl-tRNA hydrolase [Wolbachia endosymbiont of Dirofilaria (Dirofilaria) immitis]|uniref:aminoacyl-tRNA hydrolase n=1 Tax=Wolbachia endosymbiont of Dirofilaria (Dirofilaria) immitis TaxID=1812115 RepID=UPI00158B2504|nr:aminoacyl-tRNA hydrolase [Wolbachia endosymbiont of Dirofilaria (Dirofilaria) immitis]QKX02480.1 aminoacyl-tRNA hydrolase [Wolbachia endosymbiont of Dirofilaria (Dirofilaria) immitis]